MSESCFIKLSSSSSYYNLPCYPDEVSDSTSSNWTDQSILGRSSPIEAFTGTSARGVSFSFDLHRDMDGPDYSSNNIEKILEVLRSSVYPEYTSPGFVPIIVLFVFGEFKVRGAVKSVDFTWKKPIIDGYYSVCSVSVKVDEMPTSVRGSSELGSSLNPFKNST
jgi:hypothetical protein